MHVMQLRHVRAFLAVAETGSIRMAAERLRVSQPALSKTIQELEGLLSAPLFSRSAHGSVPTDYGRAFLLRARAINGEFERAKAEIDQMLDAKSGRVVIGLSAIAAMLMASPALERFWRTKPDIQVHIVDGLLDQLLGAVRQGAVDFAVGGVATSSLSNDLVAEPLFENRIVPVVRTGHPLAGAHTLADLAGADWMFTNEQPAFLTLMTEQFASQGLPAPKVRLTCESFAAVLDVVPNSNLVAALPKSILGHPLIQGRMVGVTLVEPAPRTVVSLVHRAGLPLTPFAVRLARDFRQVAKRFDHL